MMRIPEFHFDRLPGQQVSVERQAADVLSDIPAWAVGAVMYQIFPDRFCQGSPGNDVLDGEYLYDGERPSHHVGYWHTLPAAEDYANFYGGDLIGVRQKLDYLQYLGIEVIYLNPIFVSPSNHKYDTQDYLHVDPHLTGFILPGTVSLRERYRAVTTDPAILESSDRVFAGLCREIHRRGMRVILDGVFNHCGSGHFWMDREGLYEENPAYGPGAFRHSDSRFREYFSFREDGSYEGWWNFRTLPKLNYDDSYRLADEIFAVAEKWLSPPYEIDGWRLDVAADLGHSEETNHRFWREFRRRVKRIRPDALILAEHYGDPSSWLDGTQWDTVMNYDAFMEPFSLFLTGMDKHSDSYDADGEGNGSLFWETVAEKTARLPGPAAACAMNQLDNHDHSRFMTRTNRVPGRLVNAGSEAASEDVRPSLYRLGVLCQMTWPGAPTLYYGDETGMCGWTDPDCRRPFPWGREDWELIEYHRVLIGLHKAHTALRYGDLIPLAGGEGWIAWMRRDGEERILVFANPSEEEQEVSVSAGEAGLPAAGELRRMMLTSADGYSAGEAVIRYAGGQIVLTLPPEGGLILLA